ncbi:MAG TPA: hypothetical protein VMU81_26105 [Acetobacteraceae bacterium]|jgi:hypothetical protein|nr:hypothetical protein [Acetobacteraceae bacterium]
MVRLGCAALLVLGLLPLAAHADCQYRRLNSVSNDGATVQLDDGSQWDVSDYDQNEARSWEQDATITACQDELINTEVHESVEAREVKRGLPVPQDEPN